MKISASGEYAVQIMVEIASFDNYISLKEVAKRQNISLKYAEKIASKLLKAGLLDSLRGQDGGYKLAKSADKCSIKEILLATGDISPIVPCFEKDCPKLDSCPSLTVWQKLDGHINQFLGKITIADLLDKKNS